MLGLAAVASQSPPAGFGAGGRSPLPLAVVVISVLVAVAAGSALLLVLFRNTTGPGQTLRSYYQTVAAGDCGRAYGDLSPPLHESITEGRFCRAVLAGRGASPTSITILAVTGCGEPPADFARVTIREHGPRASAGEVDWEMVREGNDWLVASFPKLRRLVRSEPPPSKPRVPRACRLGG